MNYTINVARKVGAVYRHLFATNPGSILSVQDAQEVLEMLRARFPAPEFKVSLYRREIHMQELECP